MPAVDEIFPDARLRQVHHAAVSAGVEEAWDELDCLDVRSVGLGRRPLGAHAGFRRLGGEPGREVVAGGIARFWEPDASWASPAEGFAGFTAPGWGKIAWSLRIDPRVHGGSWLTFDLRAGATDDEAWRRFHRWWRTAARFTLPVRLRHAVLDRLARALGEPAPRALPGDELLCTSCSERTRRRFVEVPPAQLWPWIARPQGDVLQVGERVDAPTMGAGSFAVLRVDDGRALVIGTPTLLGEEPCDPETPLRSTWAFVIEPVGDSASQLEVRVRTEYRPTMRAVAQGLARGLIDEVAERRRLTKLCQRAEHAALH